jgi:hypothetical protein
MTLYPTLHRRRNATLAGDLAVLLLVVLFAWLGVRVHDRVADLAGLGRGLQDAGAAVGGTARGAADAVRTGFGSAADAVDGTPVVGGDLAGALRSAGDSAGAPVEQAGAGEARRLIAAGRDGEARAYRAADILGWVTFGLPTVLLLALWLPGRIRLARCVRDARRVLAAAPLDPDRERELARRAVYTLPYAALLARTRDPVGDLLAGRHEPLLAALGDDAGLRLATRARAGRA